MSQSTRSGPVSQARSPRSSRRTRHRRARSRSTRSPSSRAGPRRSPKPSRALPSPSRGCSPTRTQGLPGGLRSGWASHHGRSARRCRSWVEPLEASIARRTRRGWRNSTPGARELRPPNQDSRRSCVEWCEQRSSRIGRGRPRSEKARGPRSTRRGDLPWPSPGSNQAAGSAAADLESADGSGRLRSQR